MFKMRFIIAMVAIASTSSVAVAGPYAPYNKRFWPPTTAYSSWHGVYMGAHGGYGWGDSDISEQPFQSVIDASPIPIRSSFDSSHNVDGGLGGVHLGINEQYGHFVIGGEIRISGANIEGSTRDCGGATSFYAPLLSPAIGTATCDTTVDWVAAALARLGYAHNRWLFYGTLGWAAAGIDYDLSIVLTAPEVGTLTFPSGQNDTADGFAFGGGIEYAISDGVSFGVEYTRMNLKSDGSGLLNGSGLFLGGTVSRGERDVDLNTVTGRLNFNFDG